ncbi:chloride channel [Chamberlinius hualienensis]
MLRNYLVFSLAIVLLVYPSTTLGRIPVLENNGFRGVTVSIGSSIVAGDRSAMVNIVDQLKTLINNASIELYAATGNRANFYNVTILIPSTWTEWYTSNGRSSDDINRIAALDQTRFLKSDIRLDSPNAAYGDLPYVEQPGTCGEMGNFIHITKKFLFGPDNTPYGTRARLLARAWITYYFGVYDEHGYDYNDMYPPMYFASNGQPKYTSCSNEEVNYNTFECSGNSKVAGLRASCTAKVDPANPNKDITSSLMTLPIASWATTVCTKDNHNSDAPTKHNVMCDGKSVMDVILQNKQFQNGQNPPSTISKPPNTIFTTFQTSPNVRMGLYVVWDIQNADQNYYSGGPAMSKFIQVDIPDGSMFGYTSTENSSGIVFEEINSQEIRDQILLRIAPSQITLQGGDVAVAIETAVEKLNTLPQSDYIGAVLIVTDNTNQETWSRICSTVNGHDYQIHLITYTSAAVARYVTGQCQGTQNIIKALVQPPIDMISNSTTEKDNIVDCFKQLQERQQIDQVLRKLPSTILPSIYSPPFVYKDLMYVNETSGKFTIDDIKTTSINSTIYVETCQNLNTPHTYNEILRCTVGEKSCDTLKTDSTKSICMDIPLTTGTDWNFHCERRYKELPVPYVVSVIGKPTSAAPVSVDDQPIQLYSWINYDAQSNQQYTPVKIFASVKKGASPVFNASVEAAVTGDATNNFTVITLRDDGSGNPDVSADDGVYSGYFTQFGTSEAYSVNVRATDNSLAAAVPTKPYPWITHNNDMVLNPTETFSRESMAGSFVGQANGGNVIEPGRIFDLRVESSVGAAVTLAWTAPGDDLDHGTVQKYIIKCSNNKGDLTSTQFVAYYMEPAGLTTAAKAGISLGVIFGIILIILIFVLIWCCCFKKNKAAKKLVATNNGNDQHQSSPLPNATEYQRMSKVDIDSKMNVATYTTPAHTTIDETMIPLKQGDQSYNKGSRSSLNSSGKNTTAATAVVQDSRTPSPNPNRYDGGRYPNLYGADDDSDDDDVLEGDATAAVPQILTKTAMLQDTKVYRDSPKVPPKPHLQEVPKYAQLLPGHPPSTQMGPSRSAQV